MKELTTKIFILCFLLISIQSFSQVKIISEEEFAKCRITDFAYMNNGNFMRFRGRIDYLTAKFEKIEFDTVSHMLHLKGKITHFKEYENTPLIDINVGEITKFDSTQNILNIKFLEKYSPEENNAFDFSFVLKNLQTLVSFNTRETDTDLITMNISDIFQAGKLLLK